MALWTPASISPAANPYTWLDFSDAAARTIDIGITQIADKFGNGNHATQSADASQPAVSSAAINGLDAALFDGSNDRLDFTSAVLQPKSTLFIVFKPTIEVVLGFLFGQYVADGTGRTGIACNQVSSGTTTSGQLNPFNTTSSSGAGSGGVINHFPISNSPTIVTLSLDIPGTENFKTYKHDVLQDSATITAVYTAISSALGAACAESSLYFYDGLIAELIVLHSVASAELRNTITGYLAWKWGTVADLAADHPYKSAAPTTNKVSGVVTVNGSPAARTVAVFRRSDFTLLGTTTSNATTGAFEISNGLIPADANALLVTAIDATGTYNAVSVDYITSVS